MSESSSENNSSPSYPKRKKKAISRNKVGQKFSSIWNYFIAGKIVGGGHYEATCKFCNKNWKRGIPKKMAAHICNECTKVHASIRKTVLTKFVKEYNSIPTNETEEIEIPKLSSSTSNIQEFFENVKLPAGRKKEIDRSLIRAFIMCGFPFSAVENPFFIEFLKQLNSGYDPPSSDTLSGSFLDVEAVNINLKIENKLEKSKNLTLGKLFFINIILNKYLLNLLLLGMNG